MTPVRVITMESLSSLAEAIEEDDADTDDALFFCRDLAAAREDVALFFLFTRRGISAAGSLASFSSLPISSSRRRDAGSRPFTL